MSLLRNLMSSVNPNAVPPTEQQSEQTGGIRNPHVGEPDLSTNYVLKFLEHYDTSPQLSRDGGTDGYMHVSSLIGLACERRSVLMQTHGVKHWEKVSGGHRIMWAQGRATEHHIRSGVIASRDGKGIYGHWHCKCGFATHLGDRPRADLLCQKCEHPMHEYGEPLLMDHEHRITGSPDLTLILPRDYLLVIEIKSMTPDQFDDLEAPLPDHVNQAVMYREMYRRLGFKVHSLVAVIYGRKQFRWGGVFNKKPVYKEFHVSATDRTASIMITGCFDRASLIKRHVDSRSLPARDKCTSPDSTAAKKCPVAHLCFNMQG